MLSEIWYTESGDTVDVLVPFLSGVGEATDAMRIADKAEDIVDAIDDVYDTTKTLGTANDITKSVIDIKNTSENTFSSIKYTDKVLKQMQNTNDLNHAFPIMIDKFVDLNKASILTGNDNVQRYLVQIPGRINNRVGVFEYIIDFDGWCNHRFFRSIK